MQKTLSLTLTFTVVFNLCLLNGFAGDSTVHSSVLEGHTDRVTSVAFSPDGQTLASGSWDKTIRFWDAHTGTLKTTLEGHTDYVYCVAFSPDGKTIAKVEVKIKQFNYVMDTLGLLKQFLKGVQITSIPCPPAVALDIWKPQRYNASPYVARRFPFL